MSARGFLGAGDLYIARYNPAIGGFDAFKGPYEATKFEVKPNVEVKEMTSRGRTTYGQVIESVSLPQAATFTLDLAEVNRESLTIALLGTETPVNQAAGTITDEIVALKNGSWAQLSKQNFAEAGFSVKEGAKTYVKGTDYEVNYRLGWVRPIPGSSLAAAIEAAADKSLPVKVSGSYNATTGSMIRGATNNEIRAKLRLDGVNFADKLPVIVDVHEAVIAADSAFDFLQDDFATLSLPGRLKTPAGRQEPFTVTLLDAA